MNKISSIQHDLNFFFYICNNKVQEGNLTFIEKRMAIYFVMKLEFYKKFLSIMVAFKVCLITIKKNYLLTNYRYIDNF
jgi:hypothetical protein